MFWWRLVVVSAVLVACGSSEQQGAIDTVEECEAAGGRAVANPGGGVMCESTEEQIGYLPFAIEGGICCRPR